MGLDRPKMSIQLSDYRKPPAWPECSEAWVAIDDIDFSWADSVKVMKPLASARTFPQGRAGHIGSGGVTFHPKEVNEVSSISYSG